MFLILAPHKPVPPDACTTVASIMPRMFCVVTGDTANVYVNKKCIRKFQHAENGVIKRDKVHAREKIRCTKMFKALTMKSPLYISKRGLSK